MKKSELRQIIRNELNEISSDARYEDMSITQLAQVI